jgi:hypothetical protein
MPQYTARGKLVAFKQKLQNWFSAQYQTLSEVDVGKKAMVAFLLLLSFNSFYLTRHTPTNWDMLAYAWLALPDSEFSDQEKFTEVYRLARDKIGPVEYDKLVGKQDFSDEAYRQKVSKDSDLFKEQLGFYRVKPALPAAMRALGSLGIDPLVAGKYIVVFSYFGFGLLFFLLLRTKAPDIIAAPVSYIALSAPFTTIVGWHIAPDALSCFVLLAAFYLNQITRNHFAAMALLIVSIFIRPDNTILAGVFLLSLALLNVGSRKWLAFAAVVLVSEYAFLMSSVDYFGWTAHFYVTFVDRIAEIAAFQPELTFSDYLARYPAIMVAAIRRSDFFVFILIALWLIATEIKGDGFGQFFARFYRLIFVVSAGGLAVFLALEVIGTPAPTAAKIWFWFALIAATFLGAAVMMFRIYFLPSRGAVPVQRNVIQILVPVSVYMILHFTLFPVDKNRMLLASFLVIIYFLVARIAEVFAGGYVNKPNNSHHLTA